MKTRLQCYFSLCILAFILTTCSNPREVPEEPEPMIPFGTFIEGEQFTDLEIYVPYGKRTEFESPILSPDESMLAYHVFIPGDFDADSSGLFVMDISTGESRLLVPGSSAVTPAWSPDSKWLALSWSGNIYKIKANGDSLTRLSNGDFDFFPTWKPNGELIAYSNEFSGLWLTEGDGKNPKSIHNSSEPSWFPDGNRILTFAGEVIDLEGEILEDFEGFFVNNQVSPDGLRIAHTTKEGIWMLSTDQSRDASRRILPNHDPFGEEEKKVSSLYPSWHPDGKRLIYAQFETLSAGQRVTFGGTFTEREGYFRVYIVDVEEALAGSNL